MLFKWFIFGAIPGFVLGIAGGAGLGGALFGAFITGVLSIALRKKLFWIFWK